jgi:hypothetical protein
VEADGSSEAADKAIKQFAQAVEKTSLPLWPVTSVETLGEDEDFGDLDSDLQ